MSLIGGFAVLSQQTSFVNLPFRTKTIYFSVSGLCLCQSSIVSALIGQIKVLSLYKLCVYRDNIVTIGGDFQQGMESVS